MASDNNFAGFAGYIQFDPAERQVNNQTVRAVVIRAVGSNRRIDITVWPDLDEIPLEKGDFIAAEGKYSERTQQKPSGESVTFRNLSANKLDNLSRPGERRGVQQNTAAAPADSEDFDF